MKKKLLVVIILGLFLLGVTGCGNKIKEKDLIGLTYVRPTTRTTDIDHWEFQEDNILYFYTTNCLVDLGVSDETVPICYENYANYEIDKDGIIIVSNATGSGKWKISEDFSTISALAFITEKPTGEVLIRAN